MIQFRLFHLVAMIPRTMIGVVIAKMLEISQSKTTMSLMTLSLTYWNQHQDLTLGQILHNQALGTKPLSLILNPVLCLIQQSRTLNQMTHGALTGPQHAQKALGVLVIRQIQRLPLTLLLGKTLQYLRRLIRQIPPQNHLIRSFAQALIS